MPTSRLSALIAWRHALYAGLGLTAACGGTVSSDGGGSKVDFEHRAAAAECGPYSPRPESQIPEGSDPTMGSFACTYDADCRDAQNGFCQFVDSQISGQTYCLYGCLTDTDCDTGTVCDCNAGATGQCVTAACVTDADCAGSRLCLRSEFESGCGTEIRYHCQTSADTCTQNADCEQYETCGWNDQEGRHACMGPICAIGRPFLVRQAERLASPERTSGWLVNRVSDVSTGEESTSPCAPWQARVLAERWTRAGLMEHASIAAFARFAMQLLAFGAPPSLVLAASEAMADETRHAQIAFGFATRHAGQPVGPGPLAMDGALEDADLASVLANVVREGCSGETVAAYEAAVAAEAAVDPDVRRALGGIAADERRHAELAWQFVRWAIARDPQLRPIALRALEQEHARAISAAVPPAGDDWLSPHGIVAERQRRALRIEALEHLALPCLRDLCKDALRAA